MTEPRPNMPQEGAPASESRNARPAEQPEAAQRMPWEAPRLNRFGPVSDVTQGISYRAGDGIYNLT